ncbi:MAG TPA: TIGR00725 family protein [Kofleriaceae bacterium]|nr:TIGR00725 family protein [Kofleriaceae bacterium]
MTARRPIVAIIGDARLEDPQRVEEAHRLGAALLAAGFRIVTGGLGGVMEAVSFGARHSSHWREGLIIGVIPSYRVADANPWCDVVIPTGMQLARNVLVVSTADVVLAVGGGAGTLSEIAMASQLGKPLVALGPHGWAGRVAGEPLDGRSTAPIRGCQSVDEAVAACCELLANVRDSGDIDSGFRRPGGEL